MSDQPNQSHSPFKANYTPPTASFSRGCLPIIIVLLLGLVMTCLTTNQ